MQRFAAAVVEHGRGGRQVRADVLRDRAVVHVAMAGIDVDRMLGIPEGDPIAHHFVPRSPEAGGLYRNHRPPPQDGHRAVPAAPQIAVLSSTPAVAQGMWVL